MQEARVTETQPLPPGNPDGAGGGGEIIREKTCIDITLLKARYVIIVLV